MVIFRRGPGGQHHRLAKIPAVYVSSRPVLGVDRPPIAGAVVIISIKVLEAQRVGIIRHQLIVFDIIAEIHSGHLSRRQTGAVPPILQLVVVDVGHVPYMVVIDCVIIGVVDRDAHRGLCGRDDPEPVRQQQLVL